MFSKNYYSYAKTLLLTAILASTTLALTACGKVVSKANSGSTSSSSSNSGTASSTEQGATAKFNAYTEGYNKLIGTFGLSETYEKYVKANNTQKKATDSINLTDGWVDTALNKFKAAKAMPASGFDELDKSADVLIASLDKLVTQLKTLKIYVDSKAYREDNLAKLKAEDAALLANFAASTAAAEKFNILLSAEQKKRTTAQLAAMKASGDSLGYSTKLALQQGEELVSLFANEKDINNAEKYKAADALVAALDKTLTDQREHYAAAKAKTPSPDSGHESVGRYLVQLIGSYRDLKQTKKSQNFNQMVKNYNDAIGSANRIRG